MIEFYGIGDSLPEQGAHARPPLGPRAGLLPGGPGAGRGPVRPPPPGDAGTALALAELLDRLWRGELPSGPRARSFVLGHLRNGWIDTRILAGLPPGTPVWHKTGTYGEAATHDAGIVELPDGTHLIVVVLTRQPRRDTEAAERTIAAIARAAWEFWVVPPKRAAEARSQNR